MALGITIMQLLPLGHCFHVPPLLVCKSLLRAVGYTPISIIK